MRWFDPDSADSDDRLRDYDKDCYGDALLRRRHREIVRRCEGRPLAEILPGTELAGEYGRCWLLKAEFRGALRRWERRTAEADLLCSTHLIRGIRDRTRKKLALDGIASIADLETHPRFGPDSRRIRTLLETGSTVELAEVLGSRLPKSDPLVLRLCGMHDDSEFLFLDLETMGLFAGQPIVVAGIARLGPGNRIMVEQFVCRDLDDELQLVAEVNRRLRESRVLVTFNGKAFDLPQVQARSAYYGIRFGFKGLHFDLLHFCRRAWRREIGACDLSSIEHAILGQTRDEDLPGELVPLFFHQYLSTGNAGFLKPIVDHNRQDVVSLVNILTELVNHWSGNTQARSALRD